MKKIIFLLSLTLLLVTCVSQKNAKLEKRFQDIILDDDIYAQHISVIKKDSQILEFVYSDEKTLSLKSAYYETNSSKHQINFIDKIDTSSDISLLKGKHLFLSDNTTDYLFYIDYVSNTEKLFKFLQKNKKEKIWQVTPYSVAPKDFAGLFFDNQIFLATYDGELKFFIFNKEEKSLNSVNIPRKNINEMNIKGQMNLLYSSLFKTFYLFFLDSNNELCQINIKISNRKNSELNFVDIKEIIISENVLLYKAKIINNGPYILYYKNDGAFKIHYRNNDKINVDTIGYFASIQAIDFFYFNKKTFFLYSSPVDVKNITTERKYNLFLIYNQAPINKKPQWQEEAIKYSDTPIINITETILKNKLYLVLGGNRIDLLSLNTKFLP